MTFWVKCKAEREEEEEDEVDDHSRKLQSPSAPPLKEIAISIILSNFFFF